MPEVVLRVPVLPFLPSLQVVRPVGSDGAARTPQRAPSPLRRAAVRTSKRWDPRLSSSDRAAPRGTVEESTKKNRREEHNVSSTQDAIQEASASPACMVCIHLRSYRSGDVVSDWLLIPGSECTYL